MNSANMMAVTMAEYRHVVGGVLLDQLGGVPKGDAGVQHLGGGDAAHGVKGKGRHRAAKAGAGRGIGAIAAPLLGGPAVGALGAALVDGGVVVLLRLPSEGGPAAVAEQGAVAVQGAAHRALLVLDFRPGVWRLGRGRRLPLLAFFMQVVENTRAFFLITSPVVGRAALRADDNVIPRAEGHPAHRALDSSVIQHKWSFP